MVVPLLNLSINLSNHSDALLTGATTKALWSSPRSTFVIEMMFELDHHDVGHIVNLDYVVELKPSNEP